MTCQSAGLPRLPPPIRWSRRSARSRPRRCRSATAGRDAVCIEIARRLDVPARAGIAETGTADQVVPFMNHTAAWPLSFSNLIAVPSVCQVRSWFAGRGTLSPFTCQLGPDCRDCRWRSPRCRSTPRSRPRRSNSETGCRKSRRHCSRRRRSTCQLGPGLPRLPLPITVVPFNSQTATSPLSFCHRMSERRRR